jgi:hypothetical protein
MASKIDLKKFQENLRVQGQIQGNRCEDARNSDNGDLAAAAIAVSCLVYLRGMAEYKVLSAKDVQAFIDGFLDKAGVEEVEDRMGHIRYQRVQRKEKSNG